ncbi:aspartate aminotransferase family protein [Jannaschia seohaensis]|uniref:4-aminobutyrate---pyruvate transaminase n=1 Tax=Jannaschia seohaensis TaxID=475081 RepID=A0A2Y9A3J6_9RHOB|nr:aminotransferase class III-fold pyridoxal phosphate-dependent enzyme [Jannaschia seohaensis]PWJ22148.1 4-aminobutyrate--pyruvate transaminase [Jannaschia seohaensis]SSA38426.1 4-aminobutyrate---pyruvate transaminase [Jannaschia seohaensis]
MNAHLHPFTDPRATEVAPPREIVSGEGVRVTDAEGNVFIDGMAGLWCASLGFAPERLRRAASDQMAKLAYYHSFKGRTTDVTERLSKALAARLPGDLGHLVYGTSGSEAVEVAIKMARYAQAGRGQEGRTRIIARTGAYHGSVTMSAALTGLQYVHDGFHLPASDVIRVGRPHWVDEAGPGESERAFADRLVAELEEMIEAEGADTIAAMIGEPVMGAGGVLLPPEGYWEGVQEVLRRHGILLIADEVITGFGRTGRWFGCETYGIAPDLMTMAKQLTGAVFPLSAVAMTGAVRDSVADRAHEFGMLGHGVTYGGHPVGAAVALETLAIYEEMKLEERTAELGARLAAGLAPLRQHPDVREVRQVGFVAGVQFDSAETGLRVGEAAEARGVFLRIVGPTLAICPPYVATPEDIDEICRVLIESAG